MPDPTLEDIIPALLQQKKMEDIEGQRKAAATYLGGYAAPNLTDYLTQPRQTPGPYKQPLSGTAGPPSPITAGKIPSESPIDPRLVAAGRDAGMLGAGGLLGRVAAPLAEGAAGLAGRVAAPSLDSSGALRAIGGMGMLTPPDTAQAAGMRLPYEERVKLKAQEEQARITREDEAAKAAQQQESEIARTQAQTQSQIDSDKAKAEAQRQLEAQRQSDIADALKRQREQPFREKYAGAAEMMPVAGMAASAAIPFATGLVNKIPLGRFTGGWQKAADTAEQALKGRSKGPATLAVSKLQDFENKWPGMEKRYTPGLGQTALTAVIPAEMTAFPTEYDAMTQNPNSPSKPTMEDIISTAGRAGLAGAVGTGAAKFGAGLVPKTRPYVGGQGIVNAYNRRYPPTKTELKAIADQLKLPAPR